jgi:hypothetical protein
MRHEIIDDAKVRGAMKGAYARFWLGGNRYMVKYMPLADIEKSCANRPRLEWNSNKVAKCPPWYALKTVIRQGAKYLPKNKNALLGLRGVRSRRASRSRHRSRRAVRRHRDHGPRRRRDALPVDTTTGELVGADVTTPAAARTERGTLEWARAFPLPWRNSEQYGKPIGDFSRDHLASIATWCENRINAAAEQNKTMPQSTVDLYDATQLLLEDLDSQRRRPRSADQSPRSAPVTRRGRSVEAAVQDAS